MIKLNKLTAGVEVEVSIPLCSKLKKNQVLESPFFFKKSFQLKSMMFSELN